MTNKDNNANKDDWHFISFLNLYLEHPYNVHGCVLIQENKLLNQQNRQFHNNKVY